MERGGGWRGGKKQGGIISPLLSNLVLHEFDVYMRKLISQKLDESSGIRKEITNRMYNRLSYRIQKLRKELKSSDSIHSQKRSEKSNKGKEQTSLYFIEP